MYDAIVVGGGVVGLAAAYELVCAGARALLVDRADEGRATAAGAGILAPESNSRDPDAWFDFAVVAVGYYPELVARLAADGAGDTGYAVCGQLTVAVSADEVEPFAAARRLVFERQQRRGTPAPEDLRDVAPAEARAMFPALAPVQAAFYYRGAARVDGRLLAAALRQAAAARGLEVRQGSAERIVVRDGAAQGVVVDGEELTGGAVAIAGGAWSPQLGDPLGVRIPVAPQRGQIIHLELPGEETAGWPIITAFRGHYIVAWPGGRVVVGATREAGAGFDVRATAAGVHEVLDEALRVAPGLAGATLREVRIGLRPATPDGLPVLGPAPGVRNLYLATGHGPTGLQLGPYSGKLTADLILGRQLAVDIAPFALSRFSG